MWVGSPFTSTLIPAEQFIKSSMFLYTFMFTNVKSGKKTRTQSLILALDINNLSVFPAKYLKPEQYSYQFAADDKSAM